APQSGRRVPAIFPRGGRATPPPRTVRSPPGVGVPPAPAVRPAPPAPPRPCRGSSPLPRSPSEGERGRGEGATDRSPPMKRLNVRFLLCVTALAAALAAGVWLLHEFQAGRIADGLLWQARRAEKEGRLDQTAKFLARYLELRPDDNEERANLGRVLASEQLA